MKTHYMTKSGRACHLKSIGRNTDNTFDVDCGFCMKKAVFVDAMAVAVAEKMEAFLAQKPREVKEPWKDGVITCSAKVEGSEFARMQCGSTMLRQGDRTCYGHYDNYVCADCGATTSRLTETGMSF